MEGTDPYGFRVRQTDALETLTFRFLSSATARSLLVPKNFYATRTVEELEAELDGIRVEFNPLLDEPEPQAGLVQPLDVE